VRRDGGVARPYALANDQTVDCSLPSNVLDLTNIVEAGANDLWRPARRNSRVAFGMVRYIKYNESVRFHSGTMGDSPNARVVFRRRDAQNADLSTCRVL
jgi:hypothetical protein